MKEEDEKISYMDLGADHKPYIEAKKPMKKPHFKLVHMPKMDHTFWSHFGWGALSLFVGISVASFVTQGVLLMSDYVIDDVSPNWAVLPFTAKTDSQNKQKNSQNEPLGESRALGSDDGDDVAGDVSKMKYLTDKNAKLESMSGQAYIIADYDTGEIILSKNTEFVSPIASVSKLMTGVVAREYMSPQDIATVSRDSYSTYGTQGELVLGEKIRIGELMYPLLIESSNDGAEVISDEYGRDKFMELMNKTALTIGMQSTYYDDPSGLSARNVSTASDLLKLILYIKDKHPEIFDITRVRQYSINKHQWINKNRLAQYASFVGGKNGYIDESRQTTASIFNTELKKGKRNIAIIVLKSNDRNGDVAKLLNYLKKYVEYVPL